MSLEDEFNGNSIAVRQHAEVGDNIAQRVTLETGLNKTDDAITTYPKGATPVNLTTTGTVLNAPGQLLGFYVNSTNAGTLVINDNTTAVSGTITPAIGYHAFPSTYAASIKVTIGGTALNVTFFVIAD